MTHDELREAVTKLLCLENDFSTEEAEEAINSSMTDRPDLWDENADPKDLANFLASDGNDD